FYQIAVCREAPAMVGAGECSIISVVVAAQLHSAVRTAVEQYLDFTLTIAGENHRVGTHAGYKIIVWIRYQAFMAYEEPGSGEYTGDLFLEDFLVREDGALY